jgi:hypothetical protein
MKKLLLISTAILGWIVAHGQTTLGRTYGTANDDYGYSVTKTLDSGYIIGTPYNNGQWGIIKTNEQGDTTWIRSYPFLNSTLNYQFTNSIIQTSDSNYVMVGAMPDSNSFILKVNSIGDTLWLKNSGHGLYPVFYRKVVEDNSGNLIIIGSVEIIQANQCCSPVMFKTDSYGNTISTWNPAISCPASAGCRLQEIFTDMNGNYLVSGDAPSPNVPNPRLTKVDTSGNVVWNKYYSITNASVIGITQSPDSGYILVGPNWNGNDSTYVFKTDKDGNLQWLKKFKANSPGWNGSSIDTTNGGYLISGTNGNICLMKLDLNFNFVWTNEFGGSLNEQFGQMHSTNDGGCVIVGSTKSFGSGGYDVYLIKTDQNGQAVAVTEIHPTEYTLIYPNPFSSQTTLSTAEQLKNATLTMDNCFGQTVKEINNINGQTVVLTRDNLATGLYFARLTQSNQIIKTVKLVIVDN